MSVKCEQPLDELTVQVWLLYDHPNFKYCTFVYKRDGITDGRTDGQTDGQTDGRTIQTLDAPGGPLSHGALKLLKPRKIFKQPNPTLIVITHVLAY